MKEINELMDRISAGIATYSNSNQIIGYLVQISGRADYKRVYRELVQLGLIKDSVLNDLVTEAGLLLSGDHKILRDYIDKQPERNPEGEEFDAVRFKYDIGVKFTELLEALPKTSTLEQSTAMQTPGSGKRKSDVIEGDPEVSYVDRLKRQNVLESAAQFVLEDSGRAEEFRKSRGDEAFNALKALSNVKVQ